MFLLSMDRFYWAAALFGQLVLLGVLWGRGRVLSFPMFTAMTVFAAAESILLYFGYRDFQRVYGYIYWPLAAVDQALQLLVMYEIATHVFRPTGVWARDVWRTFLGMVCLCVAVAAVLTWLDTPATTDPLQAGFYRVNFFSALLMSELFVGMLALSATVGLPWKTHVARIAQGLGVYSLVCVGKDIVSTVLGVRHAIPVSLALSHFRSATYLACEGYWIAMLWQEAPAPRELPEEMRTQIYVLQRRVEYDLSRIRSWGRRY